MQMQNIDCPECTSTVTCEHCPECRGTGVVSREVPPMQRYVWTVEIAIDPQWVADGIDLTSERMQDLLERAFPYLRSSEVRARTIAAPDPDEIALEQGRARIANALATALAMGVP